MAEQFTFELDPPPGIFPDETAFSTKGRWADCNNVRWDNESGRPVVVGRSTPGGSGTMASPVRSMLAYNAGYSAGADVIKVAYATSGGSAGGLYISVPGGAVSNITPASGFNAARYAVSLATWGTTLLAAPAYGTLYESPAGAQATVVTEAPDEIVRMLVSPERRQVLAFGCTDVSGTFNNRCIRCSDLEDYSSAGSWTPTSSNNSDEVVLSDSSAIVGAEWVGGYAAVWTETSLFIGQYIGDPSQTWRFDHVASGCGLLAQRCVTVVGVSAYWMGKDGHFRMWTPGELPAIIPCPILREFHENFNQLGNAATVTKRDKAFMGAMHTKGEVWFFYNDDRDAVTSTTEPTRYMALNLRHGAWFRGDLVRTAMFDLAGFWTSLGAPLTIVLMGNTQNTITQHEAVTGNYPAWHIQTADQYLDGMRRRILVTRCEPDFEIQTDGSISLTLFCRSFPQGDVVTKGPYTLADDADKVDFRASGKIIAVKFSGNGPNAKFGRHSFDCVTLGER